ncbi:MAG: hypothetical protein M1821_009385 [Bathelium mastoideum]|nr:MAG: hypothetical protein M1821_009385 [Bathelium mastoideum]
MEVHSAEHRSKRRRTSGSQSRSTDTHNDALKRTTRLPFNATELSKADFDEYRSMFASYLKLQKQLDINDISREEAKGRWKSFVKKWNRGELAEGWYDPEIKRKTVRSITPSSSSKALPTPKRASPKYRTGISKSTDSDEDAEYGPSLPTSSTRAMPGPAIPSMQDLELRNELAVDDTLHQQKELYYERKLDRKRQKEHLEEIVPRAEPGTRERQLEKKREKADQMRSFRDKSPGATEAADAEVYGEDGIEGFKAKKRDVEKKKNERELRKEELWRARAKEREERLEQHRAKEDKTMDMLKALARERFGR